MLLSNAATIYDDAPSPTVDHEAILALGVPSGLNHPANVIIRPPAAYGPLLTLFHQCLVGYISVKRSRGNAFDASDTKPERNMDTYCLGQQQSS